VGRANALTFEPMPRAALIVLAWNQWPTTSNCLDSLRRTAPAYCQVIVVDNGSSDETPQALMAYADWVRIVRLPENLGFVRGMNAGMLAADPDADVVLLNNDLEFAQIDWLERLRDTAYADATTGVVGCRLSDGKGNIIHNGSFIIPDTMWGQQTETGTVERDIGQHPRTRVVQGIAFALAYICRDCLRDVGLLNEAFHSYFEDTDYCLRAARAGYATVVAGGVTVIHRQHGSTRDDGGFRERLFAASKQTFAAIWREPLQAQYRADISWYSTTRQPHTYAALTGSLVRRLDAAGLRVHYHSLDNSAELINGDYRLQLAAQRQHADTPAAAIAFDRLSDLVPPHGRHRIAYTFSDWDNFPAQRMGVLHGFDELWVPDAFQLGVFAAAGAKLPIRIVPFGVDAGYCHAGIAAPRHPLGRLVFLAVVDWCRRDAPDLLIDAFRRAFAATDPVELLLYVRPTLEVDVESAFSSLPQTPGCGLVRLLCDWSFPAYQRGMLYRAADVYVTARRGVGWDQGLVEALACGLPLIAPDCGSHAALVRAHGHPVSWNRVEDAEHPGAMWAEPDPDGLIAQLRRLAGEHVLARARATEASTYVAATHDIESTSRDIVGALEVVGVLGPDRSLRPLPAQPGGAAAGAHPEMPDLVSGQLIVLGMHRSGTSALCGLLDLLGAYCGARERLLHDAQDNPKGFWERGDVHDACRLTLAARGGDWSIPLGWNESVQYAHIDSFRREFLAVLEELEGKRPWFVKEPRLCLLVRDLLPLLTRPVFIHVVRDPIEVALSLQHRNGLTRAHSLALWEEYTVRAFAGSLGRPRILVDYAELLADPVAVCRSLRTRLEELGIRGLCEPDQAALREWIEPGLHRQRSQLGAEEVLSAEQLALQRALLDRSILADASPRRSSAASIGLLSTLYGEHQAAVRAERQTLP
jgi:GT2 family glycosyltransferase